ncbi:MULTISPECIES: hypothetical protein [Nocardiaceae]|uniref:hypothetical protein n=1 Tax=Nocardiaceae TaxID=85025 RepID=UPI00083446F7|nr:MULTISPECIES: hypothetical protein [Rhodococcus]
MSDRGVGAVGAAQVGSVPWPERDHAAVGLPVSFDLPVVGHLDALADLAAGAGYLEWRRYRHAAALHTELVVPEEDHDERAVDAYAQCAARIATALSVSQYVADDSSTTPSPSSTGCRGCSSACATEWSPRLSFAPSSPAPN